MSSSNVQSTYSFQFGIPSLDILLGFRRPEVSNEDGESTDPRHPEDAETGNEDRESVDPQEIPDMDRLGIHVTAPGTNISLCIVGPDGTGKSALALHLAARYAAECDPGSKILYASTDLSLPQARAMWRSFCLSRPNGRQVPFYPKERLRRREKQNLVVELEAFRYFQSEDPSNEDAVEEYIIEPHPQYETHRRVAFINLQDSTAGDDWDFLNRMVGLLEPPVSRPHLLIVDAIEGLEALVGAVDAYGQSRPRRSRVTQALRAAAAKCHIVFVVEEAIAEQRLAEEFIADAVLRLRVETVGGYRRRTVEIEKVRGQSHARGHHPYSMSDGYGSTTGDAENPDDPRVDHPEWADWVAAGRHGPKPPRFQNYFHVTPSLHYLARNIMRYRGEARKEPPIDSVAEFGITYLDDFLRVVTPRHDRHVRRLGLPDRGLPCGTITALIGDAGTRKSRLGRAFLGRHFLIYSENLVRLSQFFRELPMERAERAASLRNLLADVAVRRAWYGFLTEECRLPADTVCSDKDTREAPPLSDLHPPMPAELEDILLAVTPRKQWIEEVQAVLRDLLTTQGPAPSLPESVRDRFEVVSGRLAQLQERLNAEEATVRRRMRDEEKASRTRPGTANPPLSTTSPDDAIHRARYLLGVLKCLHPTSRVSVYLTSNDTHVQEMARAFYQQVVIARRLLHRLWHLDDTDDPEAEESNQPALIWLRHFLQAYFEQHTICRRFEIHDVNGPRLLHIFRSCIQQAQSIVFPTGVPDETNERFDQSWRIRLVIDDLRNLRDLYPDLIEDPRLLPFLLFYLGREGVTTLILDTQPGRPDATELDKTEQELRALISYHLHTWRINFFGESRTALAAYPPIGRGWPSVIRELRWESEVVHDPLTVDPHFELYRGIEEGRPELVGLEVRLYHETYGTGDILESHLRSIFRPTQGNSRIINPDPWPDDLLLAYQHLRSHTNLQRDTRLDCASVFTVDEFWSVPPQEEITDARTGDDVLVFRNERKYLFLPTWLGRYGRPDRVQDPYSLFQPTQELVTPEKRLTQDISRYDFFEKANGDSDCVNGLAPMQQDRRRSPDRIPYTWNFGMLLLNGNAWDTAIQRLKADAPENARHLEKMFTRLSQPRSAEGETISWEDFLTACFQVSLAVQDEETWPDGLVPWDFSFDSAESLSCMVLEVWASLIHANRPDSDGINPRLHTRQWRSTPSDESVQTWSERYASELYAGLTLLARILPREYSGFQGIDPHAPPVRSNRPAVAMRHWYSTACYAQRSAESELKASTGKEQPIRWVPAHLPGHFSVRGDWFLAVARGSRSWALANRALDILTSARANIDRMQTGHGLPTRFGATTSTMRTALRRGDGSHGENFTSSWLTYQEVKDLGCQEGRNDFFWLWRSSMDNYDRHARIWYRWLLGTLGEMISLRERFSDGPSRQDDGGSGGSTWEEVYKERFQERILLLQAKFRAAALATVRSE